MEKPDYLNPDNPHYKNDIESVYRKAVANDDKEEIFKCIHRICHTFACKRLAKKGYHGTDIDDIGLDATIDAFNRMETEYNKARGGMHYRSIVAWCKFSFLKVLNGRTKQEKFERDILLLDDCEEQTSILKEIK